MNRAELVDSVADMTGQTKQHVHDCMSAILHTITGAVASGDRVMLVGFGTFERRNRKARVGVNPQTRKKITIQAARIPAFRAGAELKAIVDGRQRMPAAPVGHSPAKAAKKTKKAAAKKTTKKRK
jgi:DNA-binding protein HU-beta